MVDQELWNLFAKGLRTRISDAAYLSSFEGVKPLQLNEDEWVLSVPNAVAQARIESRWTSLMEEIVADMSGRSRPIRLVREDGNGPDPVGANGSGPATGPDRVTAAVDTPVAAPNTRNTPDDDNRRLAQHRRYTFENFVIGTSNRLAHAFAHAVAETPGSCYNPLFIHGDSGLGKTHLLRAIENYLLAHFPGRHVLYVSTETFLNEFVEAIRFNNQPAFHRRYRTCDVLLVDDIQFMGTGQKEGSQEELFHTYNDLYQDSKQIVITSDRPLKSLDIDPRLTNRFIAGLTVEVRPPDHETRLAILRTKAQALRARVPDEVMELIATHVTDNIRELEGALTRVWAFSSHSPEPLTPDRVANILADLFRAEQPRPITAQGILDATCKYFEVSGDELCGPSRRRPLVTARQISMYVFRQLTDFSYPAIAREFGGRDHTTVIHAVSKIETLMEQRPRIYEQVTELTQRIRNGG